MNKHKWKALEYYIQKMTVVCVQLVDKKQNCWIAYKEVNYEQEKVYYHATSYENLGSILVDGIKASDIDGVVYMTEKEEDAIKFL